MGYFFTLLFITVAFITPGVLFGPLAPYHVEVILAALAILASIPSMLSAGLERFPQTYAVLGICCAVVASIAATGWLGGIPAVGYGFLPVAAAFFLAAVNCRKKWHLQLIVLFLFLGSVYFIARGYIDLQNHVQISPYLYQAPQAGAAPRLRGLGYVHDPNDFAQVMVSLVPLIFLWRTRSQIVNLFLLGIPIGVLIWGMYLTHSRGASIALMVVVLFGLRKKIGTIPATVLAGVLMAAVLAGGWGAGRDINIDSGEGRLDAWSAGIQYIKGHPVFGIGYDQFAEDYGITAHNSVMVCAAEIGLPGFFCWIFFLFVTFRFNLKVANGHADAENLEEGSNPGDGLKLRDRERNLGNGIPSAFDLWAAQVAQRTAASPGDLQPVGQTAGGDPGPVGLRQPALLRSDSAVLSAPSSRWNGAVIEANSPSGSASIPPQSIPPQELRRIAQLLVVSLAGFLTAGWFLSRALSIWLFMYCGLACALMRMAEQNGIVIVRDPLGRLFRWSLFVGVLLILAVYVLLRVHNIVG